MSREQDADDVLQQVAAWRREGKGVALATVVRTWGSSPRPAGSQLAVADDGAFVGSVSGGCIEGAVVKEALEVIGGGAARVLTFGVSNESAWEVGLACGGKVRVHVDRVSDRADGRVSARADGRVSARAPDIIDQLLADRAAKRAAVLASVLPAGAQTIVYPFEDPPDGAASDALAIDPAIREAAHTAATRDQSAAVDIGDQEVFLRVYNPPLRLVVVGAVHIAQALCPMAALAGFAITVVDPRTAFASAARFPGVALCTEWPDEALAALALDRRTAVVTLTHDPKLDEPALVEALRSSAFYIGALGSKKTQAARLGRLRAHGIGDQDLARIQGPVGLAIGARSTAEIAVSILAQMIEHLRRQDT